MSEFLNTLNNKEGKIYKKYKNELVQIGKNDISGTLRNLCITTFEDNKKIYNSFRNRLRLKFFLKYNIPLAFFAVLTFHNLNLEKKTATVPVYNIEQTIISDNKMIQTVDENKYIEHVGDWFAIPDDYYEDDSSLINSIQYQVKNGTRNAVVKLKLDKNNQFQIDDALIGNFFDMNADVFKDVETTTLDEKYQELVDDIGTYVSENLYHDRANIKDEITKMLEDNKTKTFIIISEAFEIDTVTLTETKGWYLTHIISSEIITFLVTILVYIVVKHLFAMGEIKAIHRNEERLIESECDTVSTSIASLRKAKEAFIEADDERKYKVKKLVKGNLDEKSISYFEK